MLTYFVRIGVLGEPARCHSGGPGRYQRGVRVVCRTELGLQTGEVCSEASPLEGERFGGQVVQAMPRILRAMTDQDRLLEQRLQRHRRQAVEACRRELAASGSAALLLDVEALLDRATPLFYFLGDPGPQATALVERLASRFESRVRSSHFAKLLAEGCGPGCGTKVCGTANESSDQPGCSRRCAVCLVAKTR